RNSRTVTTCMTVPYEVNIHRLDAAKHRWQISAQSLGSNAGPFRIHAKRGPKPNSASTHDVMPATSRPIASRGTRINAGAARRSIHGPATAETVSATASAAAWTVGLMVGSRHRGGADDRGEVQGRRRRCSP